MTAADIEADRAAEIDDLIRHFRIGTENALREATVAADAVAALMSDRVYDVDLAEGTDGKDARDELAAATRHLRNALRIAQAQAEQGER